MKLGRSSRRSIRHTIFISVLAGSVFCGSGAFAIEPTPIETQTDLQNISNNLGGNYVLIANIDVDALNAITNINADSFTGTLNGSGYTISNLTQPLFNSLSSATILDLNLSGNVELIYSCGGMTCLQDEVGILARTASNANLDAITVVGTVSGNDFVGGVAGWTTGGTITNVQANVTVVGRDYVGGILGRVNASEISMSSAQGNIEATGNSVGGLVGNLNGNITNSYANGNIVVNSNGQSIGGLVGYSSGSISNSYSTGDVIVGAGGIGGGGGWVGGLVGENAGTIQSSYALGSVNSSFDVGGLVGYTSGGLINKSYATGNVIGSGTSIGGLVGQDDGTPISNSYSIGSVTGVREVGGLIGDSLNGNISNSYATGIVIGDSDFDDFVGSGIFSKDNQSRAFSNSSPEAPSILSVVNTLEVGSEPAFEIVACKNRGLPMISALNDSYENTCASPNTNNRERRIREFLQTTAVTEIAKTFKFVISTKLSTDALIGFIKNEKELALSKILGLQKSADREARTFVRAGEALQISLRSESKEPVELWVKFPDGKWLLAGIVTFDKDGKAILPPLQFKSAGDFTLVLSKPTADSAKGSAPMNQTGSLLVEVI